MLGYPMNAHLADLGKFCMCIYFLIYVLTYFYIHSLDYTVCVRSEGMQNALINLSIY